jgi:RNA ligase (TIGR02306 family)
LRSTSQSKRDRESGEIITDDLGMPVGGLAGSRGDRVKAIRLRGVLSPGLLYAPDGIDLEEGVDYAEALGIVKWVPPVPVDMAGKAYACARISSYTEIENVKRFPGVFVDGEEVCAREKLHGTCQVCFIDVDGTFHVSSKGMAKSSLALENELTAEGKPKNAYWRSALDNETPTELARIADELRAEGVSFETIALYGETIGVQDLNYGLPKGQLAFAAFDLKVDDRYLDYDCFAALADAHAIPRVPPLYRGPFDEETLWQVASGRESYSGGEAHVREGVVVRPVVERYDTTLGRVCLKFVSEAYLLRKGDNVTEFE